MLKRYPHQNFIYYLILMGYKDKEIYNILSQWDLLFVTEDFSTILSSLKKEFPQSKLIFKKGFHYKNWMKLIGINYLVLEEYQTIKFELEDILFSKDIKYTLETLIYLGNSPLDIIRKISFKYAQDCSEKTIEAFKMLFWDQEKMTLEDWRNFAKLSFEKDNSRIPVPYLVKNMPAHYLEATLGIDAELDTSSILKDCLQEIYVKFKETMSGSDDKDNLNLALKIHKSLIKNIEMIDKNQTANTSELSNEISKGFSRAKKDKEQITEQLEFSFENNKVSLEILKDE